ncbi:uncharacterized protein LOC117604619 [Osmia lignaria lignaria]|uniref:uncharacterized protein LOC117604619 n=1 Tax=Osmia lignaria lignaria TaxID=1437193 RepID=UPI00402B99C9
MIEMIFLVLFVGSLGASAAPGASFLAENTESVWSSLPSTENLEEKAMPLSKLVVDKPFLLPGGLNLLEKSQVPAKLPGTRNLEEKRIPELVLQKLAQPPREIHQ